MTAAEHDATQVIPAADVDATAFLPPGIPFAEPHPIRDDTPALGSLVAASWEDRYATLLEEAYVGESDPSRIIAACRLAGEIREGMAAGLILRGYGG